MLTNGEFDEARKLTSEDESTISQVLNMGLSLQGAVRRREDIEIAMEESMMEIVPRLEKRTPYVALASSIATLLGLLGTIMGLIQAFTAVANANPAEKADLLSASISVAMNTTAFGLMVAIPLLIVHAILTSRQPSRHSTYFRVAPSGRHRRPKPKWPGGIITNGGPRVTRTKSTSPPS
jgi:biopolymer transport protein ExbB